MAAGFLRRNLFDRNTAGTTCRARQSTGNSPMKNLVLPFLTNDSGATAIEYGLIAAGISIAIIAAEI
jgi:hypothetical protein